MTVTLLPKSPTAPPSATGRILEVTPDVLAALTQILNALQLGEAVTVASDDHQVTTQQAANLLGVSRPHLVKLLEENRIPFQRTGSHRRLFLRDVLSYQEQRSARRRAILDEMTRQAVADGLYQPDAYPAVPPGDDL